MGAEKRFSSGALGTFTKVNWNMGHKTNSNKLKFLAIKQIPMHLREFKLCWIYSVNRMDLN